MVFAASVTMGDPGGSGPRSRGSLRPTERPLSTRLALAADPGPRRGDARRREFPGDPVKKSPPGMRAAGLYPPPLAILRRPEREPIPDGR